MEFLTCTSAPKIYLLVHQNQTYCYCSTGLSSG